MPLYNCVENGKTKYRIECNNCGKTIDDYLALDEVSKLVMLKSIETVGEYDEEYGVNVLKYFCCEECRNKYREK